MSYVNSNWQNGMQRAALTIDDKLGEMLTVIRCSTRPNFGSQPTGETFALRGVFSYRAKVVFENELSIESREPILSFASDALPCPLARQDRVQRGDRTVFEITSVKPDGVSTTVCKLVQLGLPSNRR